MAFDEAYYRRFYFNPRTAVTSRAEMGARARLIASCVDYVGLPVATILDAGCGTGWLRAPLRRLLKRASYVGLERSEYLCERYGWRRGSIESFRSRERFDLVICYDVLQYLSAPETRRAIANLARVCRGALYFGALTREDWRDNCDQTRTDPHPGATVGALVSTRAIACFSADGMRHVAEARTTLTAVESGRGRVSGDDGTAQEWLVFEGTVSCQRLRSAVQLRLQGRRRGSLDEAELLLAKVAEVPAMPSELHEVRVLAAGTRPRQLRIEAAEGHFELAAGAAHVHQAAARRFYAVLPPPRVPWISRCGWAVLLGLLRLPLAARWLRALRR